MDKKQRMEFDAQARVIIEKLTLEQKVSLMAGDLLDFTKATREQIGTLIAGLTQEETHYNIVPYSAGGIKEKNIPSMRFCDGPRGVVCGVGKSTCFPVAMARGASFDRNLEEEIGKAIGKEVRAYDGNLFAGVCVNLPYHPGWGRSQETYGEESYHIGQMGASMVKGVQSEGVMACIKHFAFNQMENARFKVSVTCDQRTEKEVFLPHFKDCVDAGAASVMSAYNRYNGVMCGHHGYLLNEVLKRDWDFDGFVMSDFFYGVNNTVEGCNGGQDIEMPAIKCFGDRLLLAVQKGFVPMDRINDAVTRIVRTLLAFEAEKKGYEESVLACEEHVELARRAAEESITLVKNEEILPLCREDVKRIALIGKLAKAPNIGDYGSSRVRPPYVITIEEGLKNANPDCEIIYLDGTDIEETISAANDADAVIFVVGYNHDDEGEFVTENSNENYLGATGGDRKNGLSLHEEDVNLLKQVGSVNPKSVAILIGGNTIMMTEWIDKLPAVLMAYYPGMEGGTAVAEIIYGDVNPSGKLPFVVPYKESDLPTVDWEATDQYYEYYHGYTRLEKNGIKPLFPYGHGLSYTTFAYSCLTARLEDEEIVATVTVANTGEVKGTEVVQLYIGFENSAVDRPIKILRGFTRISLEPKESKMVTLRCPLEKLKYYEPVSRTWKLENMEYSVFAGGSSDAKKLVSTIISL